LTGKDVLLDNLFVGDVDLSIMYFDWYRRFHNRRAHVAQLAMGKKAGAVMREIPGSGAGLKPTTPRPYFPRPTVSRFICRICKGGGTLISLEPANGYACADCVVKHGKSALIAAAQAKDAESVLMPGAIR
jgi:hypothetical protein